MEFLAWSLRTFDAFAIATPIFLNLFLCLALYQSDFIYLLAVFYYRRAFARPESFRPRSAGRPTGLVIIPSLLRDLDDFRAITTTVESCAHDEYPAELLIVASVDGVTDAPALYGELLEWVASRTWPERVAVHVTGTPCRLGKMMAIEKGVTYVKGLVAEGTLAAFPEIYFSVDGDGTLGAHTLERLAHLLTSPHPFTGNPRRIVSGKVCIRTDLTWRGWRHFFTVEGQLYLQVAREFVVSNVARFNNKLAPQLGVPGALYCTWSSLYMEAPRFMAFMQGLRFIDLVKWWFGAPPPKYSECDVEPNPEALTGASDDTCIAFLASVARWEDGRLTLDAPRTPLHALWELVRAYVVERSHDYEPEARVFTYTPPTLKGLWRQRVRWNSSRVECAGRFWRAFWYHWAIGMPVGAHSLLLVQTVFDVALYYVLLPVYVMKSNSALLTFVLGYAAQTISYSLYTILALALDTERRRIWRVVYALPLAPIYLIAINLFGCVYGVVHDIFLFGNWTNFAPEATLMKGRSERIAILFRLRRALLCAARAATHGDIPFGAFWFGWSETPWTPSGFEGWTTGKPPRATGVRRASLPSAPGRSASTTEQAIGLLAPIETERASWNAPSA